MGLKNYVEYELDDDELCIDEKQMFLYLILFFHLLFIFAVIIIILIVHRCISYMPQNNKDLKFENKHCHIPP